jgi:hypothetical protein
MLLSQTGVELVALLRCRTTHTQIADGIRMNIL